MSKIFLLNGGEIVIHSGWTQHVDQSGTATYKKGENFLGTIFPSGIVHLSDACNYTYYPPPSNNIHKAFDAVYKNIDNLYTHELKQLKKRLTRFDAKSGNWK